MSDDSQLLRHYLESNSQTAFAEFVRRHVNLVYFSALRRTTDPSLAEEVTQSVFTEAARQSRTLALHPTVTGWLYTTTRFAAVAAIRKERIRCRRQQETFMMQELTVDDPAPDWDQIRPVIDLALDSLGTLDRTAVLLRYFEGSSFAEIGAALRVSEDAARMRTERALEKLRTQLNQRGVTSTAAALITVLTTQATCAVPAQLAMTVTTKVFSAGASAAPALSALTSSATLLSGSAVLVIGALLWTTHSVQVRNTAAIDLERAFQGHHQALGRLTVAKLKAAESAARSVAPATTDAVAPGKETLTPGRKQAEPRDENHARRAANELMMRHPQVKEAIVDWHAAKVAFQFGPLFEDLRLNPEQIREVQELLRGTVLFGDWGRHGEFLLFDAPREIPGSQVSERLKALLGDDGYHAYERHRRLGQAREWTAQLARQLSLSNTPLTPSQATSLIEVFSQHSPHSATHVAGYDEAVSRAAKSFLAPDQLATLREIIVANKTFAQTEQLRRVAADEKSPNPQ